MKPKKKEYKIPAHYKKPSNVFDPYPPVQRQGVSTPNEPLPVIPVNEAYENDNPRASEEWSTDAERIDVCAPFPYQISVHDGYIQIYSSDGRIIATVPRSSFASECEYLYTARMLAYSYRFAKALQYATLLHQHEKASKMALEIARDLRHNLQLEISQYEPFYYSHKGDEYKTERGKEDEVPHNPAPEVMDIINTVADIEFEDEAFSKYVA